MDLSTKVSSDRKRMVHRPRISSLAAQSFGYGRASRVENVAVSSSSRSRRRWPRSPAVWFEAVVGRIEIAPSVDRVSSPLNAALQRGLRPGPIRDVLAGKPLGHPAHPALVSAPIGCWTGALVADLAGERRAGRLLTGLGVLSALPVAATGASDWADTTGAEQRVGAVHLGLNLTATVVFGGSWWARRRGHNHVGVSMGVAGAALAAAAGWLGGHLAYAMGVGVDTNAFDGGPTEWTGVGEQSTHPGRITSGAAAGVSLVIVQPDPDGGDGSGEPPRVLANRCSHRGGPLAEGDLTDGCLRCPWHGSQFETATGQVRRGPATMPQPLYEVRRHAGQLQVRRHESRSLRTNPVRS
jgi:Rieske Fe-S protein